MTTAQQERRMQQRFDLWDTDHDGTITRSDYEQEAYRVLQGLGEDPHTPRGEALVDAYLNMWNRLAEKAGVPPNGAMEPEQFQQVTDQEIFSNGAAGYASIVRPVIESAFAIADRNSDDGVDPDEFRTWMKAVGVEGPEADQTFRQIDTDGDGQIQLAELVDAARRHNEGELDIPLLGR